MKRFVSFALLLSGFATSLSPAQTRVAKGPVGADSTIPMCKAADLTVATDDEEGTFDGMSHSGTLLVLRNLSPKPCRVPARPQITFLDGTKPNGMPLAVKLEIPGAKYMHPGPILLPVAIAPEAEVTSKLRWVSGEVYDNNLCLTPAALAVSIGSDQKRVPLSAHICGDRAKGVTFEATPLAPDPQIASAQGAGR